MLIKTPTVYVVLKPQKEKKNVHKWGNPRMATAEECDSGLFCNSCARADLPLQIDHRIPRRNGGTNDRRNLHKLCIKCHEEKSFHEMNMRMFVGEKFDNSHREWMRFAYPEREMETMSPADYRKLLEYLKEVKFLT